MGKMNPFSKPKVPLPSTPGSAPTQQNSSAQIAAAQAAEVERLRKQRGRAGTTLYATGDDKTSGGLATSWLLGGGV